MQGCNQLLHVRRIFIIRASNQNVHVRRVAAFDDQCVRFRVQLGFQRIVGVDQRQINLGQHAWNGGSLQLTELQVLGVGGNIFWRRQDVGLVLERNQPGLVQQQQCTAAVGGVIGDYHGRTVFDFIELFVFARVSPQRLQVNSGNADQMGTFGLVELIQVRLVLEEVGVQALFGHLYVWLDIVGEYLDLEVDALFGQRRFHELQDLGVRHRGGRNRQIARVGRERRNSGHSSK